MEKINKYQVATELLDNAIRLYFEENSYFSALHLAGGAEEVLAVYLDDLGVISAFQRTQSFFRWSYIADSSYQVKKSDTEIVDYLNNPKNSVKHKRGKVDNHVEFDPVVETRKILDRAITNYCLLMPRLGLAETLQIKKYRTHQLEV